MNPQAIYAKLSLEELKKAEEKLKDKENESYQLFVMAAPSRSAAHLDRCLQFTHQRRLVRDEIRKRN